jgi:AcrR family transcriptional regulator
MTEPTSDFSAGNAGRGPDATERQPDRGAQAREQLIAHATRIFAAKGFAAASTREICEAAGVNVAAIHYYFGDKEGLYRAVLEMPIVEMTGAFGRFDDPDLPFQDAMRMFLAPFLHTACGETDDLEAATMKLHLRETLEPTPAFRAVVERVIAPVHLAVSRLVARRCGLAAPDTDIHQLVFALVAMANDYCMSREFMQMLAPDVLGRPRAVEQILDRLVGYSCALVEHEIARRRVAAPKQRASNTRPVKSALKSKAASRAQAKATPAKRKPRAR